jgi:hypothetical protein
VSRRLFYRAEGCSSDEARVNSNWSAPRATGGYKQARTRINWVCTNPRSAEHGRVPRDGVKTERKQARGLFRWARVEWLVIDARNATTKQRQGPIYSQPAEEGWDPWAVTALASTPALWIPVTARWPPFNRGLPPQGDFDTSPVTFVVAADVLPEPRRHPYRRRANPYPRRFLLRTNEQCFGFSKKLDWQIKLEPCFLQFLYGT